MQLLTLLVVAAWQPQQHLATGSEEQQQLPAVRRSVLDSDLSSNPGTLDVSATGVCAADLVHHCKHVLKQVSGMWCWCTEPLASLRCGVLVWQWGRRDRQHVCASSAFGGNTGSDRRSAGVLGYRI